MALLYRNLERAGVRSAEHDILKGNWRYHWYRNKMRLRDFAALQAGMVKAGIPVVGLKGLPLATFYYADLGVRPMADIDILVPRSLARQAVEFLLAQGYRSVWGDLEHMITKGPGGEFVKEGTSVVDLHWSVLHDCRAPWSDEGFWAGQRTRTFEGVPLSMLRPEDQILHLCAHGMRWCVVPPLRWLADVAVLVRAEGHRIDVNYLVEAAERRGMVNPVRQTFVWLDRHLDFGPGNVMRLALPRLRPGVIERLDYLWRVHVPKGRPGVVPAWVDYRRARVEAGGPGVDGFVAFYARRRSFDSRFKAAGHMVVMSTLRMPPWLLGQGWAWLVEQWREFTRGGSAVGSDLRV